MRKNRHVDRYKRIKRRATDDERGRRRGDIECERKEEPKIWIEEGIQARKEVHQSIRIGRYPKSLLTLEPTKIHTSFHNNHEIKTYTRNVEKRTRLLDDKLYFLHPHMMNTHILRTKSIFLPIAVIGVRIFYCGTHLSSLCRTTVSARRAPSTLKHCATHTHLHPVSWTFERCVFAAEILLVVGFAIRSRVQLQTQFESQSQCKSNTRTMFFLSFPLSLHSLHPIDVFDFSISHR